MCRAAAKTYIIIKRTGVVVLCCVRARIREREREGVFLSQSQYVIITTGIRDSFKTFCVADAATKKAGSDSNRAGF